MDYQVLTADQIDHFLEKGYIILRNCFENDLAAEWRELAFRRLGYDQQDPGTWEQPRVHLPSMNRISVRDFAPVAWTAICDLLGGEERLNQPDFQWADGFIINFNIGADQPWQSPSSEVGGWHKDGDFFRHFLDSPEQGLLTIVIWSDIQPQSGGTFVAGDSVKPVAQRLYQHPEGLSPGGFGGLIEHCRDFIEITGEVGDVVLLHPFILHAASQNPSGRARFITNPPVSLKEPMNFNRDNPDHFSPVEQAVLRALDLSCLDFQLTAAREQIVPERVKYQQQILAEQKGRLGLAVS